MTKNIDDAINMECCENCAYADNYSIFSNDYYCFFKRKRGNFDICEKHTHSKWIAFKTFIKSWFYLLR